MKWIGLGLLFFLGMFAASCRKGADVGANPVAASLVDSVPVAKWKELQRRRIYFAHMSVGFNIIEGVQELERANHSISLRLVESQKAEALETPGFAHSLNGENGDPLGKIVAFREALDGGLGRVVDVAMLKFCFVDFKGDTDVAKVFEEYKKAMASLKAKYPALTLVHFTVPLQVIQSGPKAWVKNVIGRAPYGLQENIARNEFNKRIRQEYEGKEALFDLATWESTSLDGSRTQFKEKGQTYAELDGNYAADSGHLNPTGRQWIAAQFLTFLASLPPSHAGSTASLASSDVSVKGIKGATTH